MRQDLCVETFEEKVMTRAVKRKNIIYSGLILIALAVCLPALIFCSQKPLTDNFQKENLSKLFPEYYSEIIAASEFKTIVLHGNSPTGKVAFNGEQIFDFLNQRKKIAVIRFVNHGMTPSVYLIRNHLGDKVMFYTAPIYPQVSSNSQMCLMFKLSSKEIKFACRFLKSNSLNKNYNV